MSFHFPSVMHYRLYSSRPGSFYDHTTTDLFSLRVDLILSKFSAVLRNVSSSIPGGVNLLFFGEIIRTYMQLVLSIVCDLVVICEPSIRFHGGLDLLMFGVQWSGIFGGAFEGTLLTCIHRHFHDGC